MFKAPSTRFPQSNRLLNKVVTARAAHFLDVPPLDGKQPARVGPVLVNAARRRAVSVLL